MTLLNLAIDLFLFIAILFMVGAIFLFFWIVTVIVFAVKDIKKEYKVTVRSDTDGKTNS